MPFIHAEDLRLSWYVRVLWAGANLLLGVLPGAVLFFHWVQQNCDLPDVQAFLHWPWIDLSELSLMAKSIWNFVLFILFGLIHSILAQRSIHAWIEKVLPPQVIRSFFLCVTGVSLFGLMSLWHSTGVQLWQWRASEAWIQGLSWMLFWGFMLLAGKLITRLGVIEFLGFKQLMMKEGELSRTEGTDQLIVVGFYRWVRHPVYTLTLAAFLITPVMSLDRMLLSLATISYLCFGIPLEEKKLIRQFGQRYLDYRKRTPALFPMLRHNTLK